MYVPGSSGKKKDEEEKSFKEKLRSKAIDLYEKELQIPAALDLGLKSDSRTQLRVLCKTVVLESSQITKRKYSHSNLSSGEWSNKGDNNTDDAISKLRSLQKERLIISRMGFADRAKQLDVEIEAMRVKAAQAKSEREQKLLGDNMAVLDRKMDRKKDRMEVVMANESMRLEESLQKEFRKMRHRQRQEFLRVLENAERRAMGKVKKCNCGNWYLCRHNKTASYNTRRPAQEVIQFRRNSKRLRRGGRSEDAQMWEDKAAEIDYGEQNKWRERIATSIIASPWGANEAMVDKLVENHKKEAAVLQKTQDVRRQVLDEKHKRRRFALENTILAEKQRLRLQVKKLYDREMQEKNKEMDLMDKSDGMSNMSATLLEVLDEDDPGVFDNMGDSPPFQPDRPKTRSLSFEAKSQQMRMSSPASPIAAPPPLAKPPVQRDLNAVEEALARARAMAASIKTAEPGSIDWNEATGRASPPKQRGGSLRTSGEWKTPAAPPAPTANLARGDGQRDNDFDDLLSYKAPQPTRRKSGEWATPAAPPAPTANLRRGADESVAPQQGQGQQYRGQYESKGQDQEPAQEERKLTAVQRLEQVERERKNVAAGLNPDGTIKKNFQYDGAVQNYWQEYGQKNAYEGDIRKLDRTAIDWKPPERAGLDNSLQLIGNEQTKRQQLTDNYTSEADRVSNLNKYQQSNAQPQQNMGMGMGMGMGFGMGQGFGMQQPSFLPAGQAQGQFQGMSQPPAWGAPPSSSSSAGMNSPQQLSMAMSLNSNMSPSPFGQAQGQLQGQGQVQGQGQGQGMGGGFVTADAGVTPAVPRMHAVAPSSPVPSNLPSFRAGRVSGAAGGPGSVGSNEAEPAVEEEEPPKEVEEEDEDRP